MLQLSEVPPTQHHSFGEMPGNVGVVFFVFGVDNCFKQSAQLQFAPMRVKKKMVRM